MKPEQLAAAGTEHAHQCALFCWAQQNHEKYPELEKGFFSIPNGGERSKSQAGRLKAEGVKSGISDTFLAIPRRGYHGFFLELKRPNSESKSEGKESKTQVDFGQFVTDNGFLYRCCYGWEEAVQSIEWYLG